MPAKNNLRKRAPRIIKAFDSFFDNIHRDMIAHIQDRMVNDVINYQFVGVITGNLRRSMTIEFNDPEQGVSTLYSDLRIAPYSPFVAGWSAKKWGRNFWRICLELYGAKTVQRAIIEYKRMISVLNKNQRYKYKNPY